jgi:probable O-glycosylation ligase (exosortase A-associated)
MKGLLFTYLLTYGGAAASLFNPFAGLLVYVCFAIIKPESLWYWAVPEGNYSRIVAIGLLLGWAFKGFGKWSFGRANTIVLALFGYWLWSAVGSTFSIDQQRSLLYVESLSKIVLPFLVGVTTIDSLKKLKQLAWVIVLSEGYVALEMNLSYFSGYNRLHAEGFGDMDNNCNAIALVTCLGMSFFLGLHAERRWRKGLAFGITALMAHAIFFSNSRGGMLALGVTMAVAFILMPKKPRDYLLFAVAVVVALRMAGPEVRKRFETAFASSEQLDESAASRLRLWALCWECMLGNPLGLGPDTFPLVADRGGFEKGKEGHTLWLQIGAEMGFPGLGCLLLFYILCVAKLWRLTGDRIEVPDPWFRYFARMVIGAIIGFMVSAQFVSLKGLEHPFYVVLIGASALKLLPQQAGAATPGRWRAASGQLRPLPRPLIGLPVR